MVFIFLAYFTLYNGLWFLVLTVTHFRGYELGKNKIQAPTYQFLNIIPQEETVRKYTVAPT